MKKVGIVSCYFKNNYGSMLQAYATKKVLDNNNIPNETISIENNVDFKKGKRKYYISQIFNFNFIKSKLGMIKMKLDTRINKKLGKNVSIRNKKYNEFRREFNMSRGNNTYSDLTKLAEERYSDVLVGSDQLWLPVNVVADYYTLNWVPDKINKISYSTSFGVSTVPKKYNNLYNKFLNRINHLSVREDKGVEIVKNVSDLNAELVCDPTILLTKDEWDEIVDKDRIIKDKYILCYFLGNNINHRKFAERLKNKTGYKIVSLNHADEYVKYSDKFCDIDPYDIGPKEWLNLVKNAEYICTDSFHCTVFSLLYNKIFFDFRRYSSKTKGSTNSRIDSLLKTVGINNERILSGLENVDDVINYKIDYKKVNKNIDNYRNKSKEWLLNSITWEADNTKHINITSKEDCCGCTACMNICPKGAIEMVEDSEGFKYPKINKDKCINCGLCKKVCPIFNFKKEEKHEQDGYVINNKDKQVRKESTSGGAFSAIANYIISNGGYVFGAAFEKDFTVTHQCVNTEKDLAKFRNSKYVQSSPKDTFKQVKELLKENKLVCYSGTPCQIEGLRNYLQKDYENLVLVDVVCRAVPSPKLLRTYLNYIKENKLNNENIERVAFRDKSKYGYKYTLMTVKSKNHIYQEGIDTDPYLRAFFTGLAIRPSCENCKFKKQYRRSDFTMWDCFNIENFSKEMDDNIGTTRLLVQSEKGRKIFEEIKDDINYKKIDNSVLIRDSRELVKSTKTNSKRKEFFEDLNSLEYKDLNKKYLPNNIKTKLEKRIRRTLVNTSIYNKIKGIAKKALKK